MRESRRVMSNKTDQYKDGVLEKLFMIGLDESKYGLQSLRLGRASAVCLTDDSRDTAGGGAKMDILKDRLEDRVIVTCNIGL